LSAQTLPRKIWFCWFQGLDSAPELVRLCHASWVRHNPGWQVIVIDSTNAGQFVDRSCGWDLENLPMEKRANLLRLALLEKHGGVWADATCYCTRPLDTWIHNCMDTGFFAFREEGGKRILANWFMAAQPGNELVRSFREVHTRYWTDLPFRDPRRFHVRVLISGLNRMLGLHKPWRDFWFSGLVRKKLAIYPYFAFHYHVAWHLRRHEASRTIFNDMPFHDASSVLKPVRLARKGTPLSKLKAEVERSSCPLYKLDWKHQLFQVPVSEALPFLFADQETGRQEYAQ